MTDLDAVRGGQEKTIRDQLSLTIQIVTDSVILLDYFPEE